MATSIRFKVEGVTFWADPDGTKYAGGEHEVSADKALSQAIAAAQSAGVLQVVSGKPDASAIESEKDSAKRDAIATEARASLYEERDAELQQAADEAAREEITERYETKMAKAAQAALEG